MKEFSSGKESRTYIYIQFWKMNVIPLVNKLYLGGVQNLRLQCEVGGWVIKNPEKL